ncbi:L,D-transpeptidase [Candidatus Tokpelaia sp.]|nr:L,D-transpeptidase [Candidatus Tokpelaia sp.]
MNRRFFLMALPGFLAACTTTGRQVGSGPSSRRHAYFASPYYHRIYGAVTDEQFPIPAVDLRQIDPRFLRREVAFSKPYAPGTIIISTSEHYAYFVLPGGRAIRYGIGVALNRSANFRGQAVVGRKASWPHWTPTVNMMRAQPARYGHMGGGLAPGPTNPLGARALYLYRNGRDTYFRLHGTIEPWSIGTNVSSGCIRFLNQDIIDLYNRVPVGARVIVLG